MNFKYPLTEIKYISNTGAMVFALKLELIKYKIVKKIHKLLKYK